MGQVINQVGEITVLTEKNVIFTNRIIKDIAVTEGENVVIRYTNQSAEGDKEQVAIVPFDLFNEKAEAHLWKIIDEATEQQITEA